MCVSVCVSVCVKEVRGCGRERQREGGIEKEREGMRHSSLTTDWLCLHLGVNLYPVYVLLVDA